MFFESQLCRKYSSILNFSNFHPIISTKVRVFRIKSHLVVWQDVQLLLLWLWHLPLLLRVHLLVGLQQREDHGATRVRVVVVPEKERKKRLL